MKQIRTEQNTGTTPVRAGFELDAANLETWLQQHVPDCSALLNIEQFKGGQSNPTYKLTTNSGLYVLRRKPPGQLLKSAHAVDREYQVMSALNNTGAAVPRTYGLCCDETVVGTWFYVMDYLEGHIFWDLPGQNKPLVERKQLWYAAIDAMAKLHNIDPVAIGLEGYGKPGNYTARQFTRWSEQYQYTKDAVNNPSMDKLIPWISERIPDDTTLAIVHGDLQFSNMMFHADEARVIAILDWELSTLGNPLADFAYFCRVYHLPLEYGGYMGEILDELGIPTQTELADYYCGLTGRNEIEHLLFYIVFSMFRLAAIRQGVAKRVLDGTATSANAKASGASAVPMADYAWSLARSLE